jgi:hypothetical protein
MKKTVLGEKVTLVCLKDDNVDGDWSIKIGEEIVGSLERW